VFSTKQTGEGAWQIGKLLPKKTTDNERSVLRRGAHREKHSAQDEGRFKSAKNCRTAVRCGTASKTAVKRKKTLNERDVPDLGSRRFPEIFHPRLCGACVHHHRKEGTGKETGPQRKCPFEESRIGPWWLAVKEGGEGSAGRDEKEISAENAGQGCIVQQGFCEFTKTGSGRRGGVWEGRR